MAPIEKSLLKAEYYDKPEGEDFAGKLVATNKLAATVGTGLAITDVLLYSHPKGYLATLGRFAYFIGPCCGIASAFTFGTFLSTRLRGKDDCYNYYVGSTGAAGVMGAWAKNFKLGLFCIGAFGIMAWVKKLSIEEGWEFLPNNPKGWGNFRSMQHDFTLTSERQKGWTTGKE